jgi:hypothetical protein
MQGAIPILALMHQPLARRRQPERLARDLFLTVEAAA